jgi:hypothetical protein
VKAHIFQVLTGVVFVVVKLYYCLFFIKAFKINYKAELLRIWQPSISWYRHSSGDAKRDLARPDEQLNRYSLIICFLTNQREFLFSIKFSFNTYLLHKLNSSSENGFVHKWRHARRKRSQKRLQAALVIHGFDYLRFAFCHQNLIFVYFLVDL